MSVSSIPKPTLDYVRQRLQAFNADPRYRAAEDAVSHVFSQWPRNEHIDQVLAKVAVLNSLYSTNIYGIYDVARHIVALSIDDRLLRGDQTLVPEIAHVEIGGKRRNNISFASKYCSWHQPTQYQIYDSLVQDVLCQYRKMFGFAVFTRAELSDYGRFVQVVEAMVRHFELHDFNRKELDKYLWLEGRALREGRF